jgi:hypothetical protein
MSNIENIINQIIVLLKEFDTVYINSSHGAMYETYLVLREDNLIEIKILVNHDKYPFYDFLFNTKDSISEFNEIVECELLTLIKSLDLPDQKVHIWLDTDLDSNKHQSCIVKYDNLKFVIEKCFLHNN